MGNWHTAQPPLTKADCMYISWLACKQLGVPYGWKN